MIIKLAIMIDKSFTNTLNKQEKSKYKSMKIGAVSLGGLLGGLNLGNLKNELKPEVGKIRRFVLEHNLANPRSGELVRKFHVTFPKAVTMAGIGAAAGSVLGLGAHLLNQKAKQLKQKSR